uniref:Mannitol 1-phosphate dehydrogenase n=1 Tax=Ganoderma boninense TaxID=34458 RepID=A0A5K1K1D9_9APHY|nr:Mannitol 1-phosphate dehydrogenase [Ganoderma boninense]
MDATRVSDGKLVLLKRIATDSMEIKIASHFSSRELREDPRNHCIPVLDVVPDQDDPTKSYLVMPFLRYVDRPPFESVQSILDCGEQLLEGLAFIHEHGVAHRDCAYKNLMMDATSLYPQGFHPVRLDRLPHNLRGWAPVRSRADAKAVTYYLVDFGISSWFRSEDTDRLVLGRSGLDQDVPELSDDTPYDPFKVDIFVLGNFFRQHFTGKFTNLTFLDPLVHQMIDQDPARRPSAADALRQWKKLGKSTWSLQRQWRPRPRESNFVVHAVADTLSLLYIVYRFLFLALL